MLGRSKKLKANSLGESLNNEALFSVLLEVREKRSLHKQGQHTFNGPFRAGLAPHMLYIPEGYVIFPPRDFQR